jgi:hypothetical protein
MRQLLFHPFQLRRFRGVLIPNSSRPSPPLRSLSRDAKPSRRSPFRGALPYLRRHYRPLPAFRGGHHVSRQSQASTSSVSLLLTHVRTSMTLMRTQTSTTSISSSTGTTSVPLLTSRKNIWNSAGITISLRTMSSLSLLSKLVTAFSPSLLRTHLSPRHSGKL